MKFSRVRLKGMLVLGVASVSADGLERAVYSAAAGVFRR